MTGLGRDGLDQSLIRPAVSTTERQHAIRQRLRRGAVRAIASRAADANDLRLLLAMFDLHPNEGRTP